MLYRMLTPDEELDRYMAQLGADTTPAETSPRRAECEKAIATDSERLYLEQINLAAISNERVRAQIQSRLNARHGQLSRLEKNLPDLRGQLTINKVSTVTACFKISRGGTSAIFAYMHTNIAGRYRAERRIVSYGPTYQSQDGEFRARTVRFLSLMRALEKYRAYTEAIERHILNLLAAEEISFHVDFYLPDEVTDTDRAALMDEIDRLRLPIKFWIACWVVSFPDIYRGIEENHMNDAYRTIMWPSDDSESGETTTAAALGSAEQQLYLKECSRELGNINYVRQFPQSTLRAARAGQKLFPMAVYEAIKVDDINFGAWRELYISSTLSNLCHNLISPSFPYVVGWQIIQHAHAGLFENLATFEKYKDSDTVAQISAGLREIDKHNYINGSIEEGPRNNKFMRLSKRIQDAIVYADSTIKLTDLAFVMTQEWIGPTLADMAVWLSAPGGDPNNKRAPPRGVPSSLVQLYSRKKEFDKIVFEFIYGFYCMNSRAGVIHGDLHMNNATMHYFANLVRLESEDVRPSAVYILAHDLIYLFPHIGVYAGIIDFSRSLLGNQARLRAEFGERFADLFLHEQRYRVMQIIYAYFPKFLVTHRQKTEELISHNLPLIFKILSAVDTYVFCGNWASMLSRADIHERLSGNATIVLRRAERLAESLIITQMGAAISGEITSADEIEWPNLTIIRECFAEYRAESIGEADIVDVFNYTNEVQWDAEDPDLLNPISSPARFARFHREYGLMGANPAFDWPDVVQSPDEADRFDAIIDAHEEDEEEDIIKFESWMMI